MGVEKKVNAAWSRSSAEADEGKNAEILQLQDRETALTAELKLANERILKLEEEASREKTAKEEIDGRQRRKRGQTPMEADRTRTLDKLVESLRADIAKRDEELKTMKSSLANLKLENAAIKRVYEAKVVTLIGLHQGIFQSKAQSAQKCKSIPDPGRSTSDERNRSGEGFSPEG